MWFGEKHKEALATLKYGILDNKGFLLLTGDVGTGKTTLINALVKSLSNDIIHASVPDPSLEKGDFFNFIGSAFGIGDRFNSKGSFLAEFRNFLHQSHYEKKKVLLIIDEAQLLTQDLLEEIRLLSNIERTETKLLNIFFIGQNEFNEVLSDVKNRAVRQRLTLHYIIDPLTLDETHNYIHHRLTVAGNNRRIFTPLAIREVYNYSEGFPRRINVICDHCLLTGYAGSKRTIDESTVLECAHELKIPEDKKDTPNHTSSPPAVCQPADQLSQSQPHHHQATKGTGSFITKACLVAAFLMVCLFYGDIFIEQLLSTPNFLNKRHNIVGDTDSYSFGIPATRPKDNNLPNLLPHPEPKIQSVNLAEAQLKKDNLLSALQVSKANDIQALKMAEPETVIPPMPSEPLIIHFQFNSNEFEKGETEKMDNFARILTFYPKTELFLKGYSDANGDQHYNQMLSTFRANLVKSYLLGKGAPADQIHVEGFGSKNPLESNTTSWGRSMNRRVEIEILTQ